MAAPKHHVLDIYNVHLHRVTERRDVKNIRRRLPFLDKTLADASAACQFATHSKTKGEPFLPHLVFWIDLKQNVDRLDLIDSAAHEAAHGASEILEWVGHDARGDEPNAYLVGWLTRWLIADLLDP